MCSFVHSHQHVLFVSAAMRHAALISVQDRTDKPIYTKQHIKLQLFNNSKIERELDVHIHPLPGGYVQPVCHTRAVACHVLGSGGGAAA